MDSAQRASCFSRNPGSHSARRRGLPSWPPGVLPDVRVRHGAWLAGIAAAVDGNHGLRVRLRIHGLGSSASGVRDGCAVWSAGGGAPYRAVPGDWAVGVLAAGHLAGVLGLAEADVR